MAVKVKDNSTRKCKAAGGIDTQISGRRKVKGRMQSRSKCIENCDSRWCAQSDISQSLRRTTAKSRVKPAQNTKPECKVTAGRSSRSHSDSKSVTLVGKDEFDGHFRQRGCKRKASCLGISEEVVAKVPRIITRQRRPR